MGINTTSRSIGDPNPRTSPGPCRATLGSVVLLTILMASAVSAFGFTIVTNGPAKTDDKVLGRTKYDPVTNEYGIDNSDAFEDWENQVSNYTDDGTFVGTANLILRFDLSNITPGTTVQRVRLKLYTTQREGNDSGTIEITRVTNAWDENTATSENRDAINTWSDWVAPTYPFGDDDGLLYATSPGLSTSVTEGFVSFDSNEGDDAALVGLVQDWIDNPSSNYGFSIYCPIRPSMTYHMLSSEAVLTWNDPWYWERIPTLTIDLVPEPTTLLLFVLGGLAVLKHNKTNRDRRRFL